jgi:hypothetical protein
MEFYTQIKNGKLLPEYASDYDKIAKLKPDTTYKVSISQPRNVAFHRKFFALLKLTYDNQEHFNNFDELRQWLIMKAGHYKRVVTPTGQMFQPKSIAFSNMSEEEFEEVYSSVLDEVCKFLDIKEEDIQLELISYM